MNTLHEEITDSVHPIARNIMKELQDAEKRIAALEAELAEAKRWISVDERMPEHPGEYLVISEYRGETRSLICEWNGDWRTVSWVKRWRPLPSAPEAK